MYQTEILVLFSHGNMGHTYHCGSFATEEAQKWLHNADIGCNTPNGTAMQLKAFTLSGISSWIKKPQEGTVYTPFASWKYI